MKTIYNKVTTADGATIGWTHAAKDGTGYYSQAGLKPRKNFIGFKHSTEAEAKASLVRNHAKLKADTEII